MAQAATPTITQNILALHNPCVEGEKARVRLRTALREEHERFTAMVNRSLIVLPSKVKAAVDHFNETLLAISAPAEERPADRHDAADRPPEPGSARVGGPPAGATPSGC